jgi:tRNA A-37 threonylcarbamoyl transferase component Bud32
MSHVSGAVGLADPQAPPGPLLASGRWSDIYILDHDRLLRRNRYRDVGLGEFELLDLVTAQGFPAPKPQGVHGRDLILERLHGPTLLQSLVAGETTLPETARILADLHTKLHAVTPPKGAQPGHVVVHLDMHPGNIILTQNRGPVLIDWTNASLGRADVDIAITAVIIAEIAVDVEDDYARPARALLAAFLLAADGDILGGLEEAVRQRLADPGLEPEELILVPHAEELVRHLRSASPRPSDVRGVPSIPTVWS